MENGLWLVAEGIVSERTKGIRHVLSLLGLSPMLTAGEHVTIMAGKWVATQEADTRYEHVWMKVLLTRNTLAQVTEVLDDGWVLLIEPSSRVRYRVWPTDLMQR